MKACLKLQAGVLFQRVPTNFKIKSTEWETYIKWFCLINLVGLLCCCWCCFYVLPVSCYYLTCHIWSVVVAMISSLHHFAMGPWSTICVLDSYRRLYWKRSIILESIIFLSLFVYWLLLHMLIFVIWINWWSGNFSIMLHIG